MGSRDGDQLVSLDRAGARGLTRSGDRGKGNERYPPLPTDPKNLVIFTALVDAVTVLDVDDRCNGLRFVELLKVRFGNAEVSNEASIAKFRQCTEVLGDGTGLLNTQVDDVEVFES